MPSTEELGRYYKSNYRSDYQSVSAGPSERHLSKRRQEAARRLARLEPYLKHDMKIIDFGCGSGEFIEAANAKGSRACGFEPGSQYASFAREVRSLQVENCGWEEYSSRRDANIVTAFHVFEHLVAPVEAMRYAQSWLLEDGMFYVEVPNMANALTKGFGCLHMAHTIGFSRFNLELLGALTGMRVVEVFDDHDVGILFTRGTSRSFSDIKEDATIEMSRWSKKTVQRQFWLYTLNKLRGRSHASYSEGKDKR